MQITWWIDVRGVIAAVKKCIDFSWNNINSNQFTLLPQPVRRERLLLLSVPAWKVYHTGRKGTETAALFTSVQWLAAHQCVPALTEKKKTKKKTLKTEITQRFRLSLGCKENLMLGCKRCFAHTNTCAHTHKHTHTKDFLRQNVFPSRLHEPPQPTPTFKPGLNSQTGPNFYSRIQILAFSRDKNNPDKHSQTLINGAKRVCF